MALKPLEPVDSFVRQGFASQLSKQFRCPAIYTTSPDKLRNLQTFLGNKQPEYPYIFLSIQSLGPNTDSYVTNRLARQGLQVTISTDNNQYQLVRLIPTNFEIEVTFITNKYSGHDLDCVEGFVRRWLFSRRNGSMLFNVDYGNTQLSISYTLSDSVPIAPRDTPTDQESVYQVVANATVHGFISEPELGTRGRINQIQLADAHPTVGVTGSQFFPF